MVPSPFTGIFEAVSDTGALRADGNYYNQDGSMKSLRPGEPVCRPISFADVVGGLATFSDDQALEYLAEDDMYISDIKINPLTSGANPATDTNTVQLVQQAAAKRWEYFTGALTVTSQNIVRPKVYWVKKGTKIQFKTNKR